MKCSSKQIHAKLNQAPRKTHFDDHAWIQHDPEKIPSIDRRTKPLTPRQQEVPNHRQLSRNTQPQMYTLFLNHSLFHRYFFSRRKSPTRPSVNINQNDRVLSVSGKLRCSRCNDELGNNLHEDLNIFQENFLF